MNYLDRGTDWNGTLYIYWAKDRDRNAIPVLTKDRDRIAVHKILERGHDCLPPVLFKKKFREILPKIDVARQGARNKSCL